MPTADATVLVEGAWDATSPQSFYRLKQNGEAGSVRLVSAEKSGARFRVRFQTVP